MALIPLEDTIGDIIGKAQRGLHIDDAELARLADVKVEDVIAVKGGKPLYGVIRRVARHLRMNSDALEIFAKKSPYPQVPVFKRGFVMSNVLDDDMYVNNYLVWDSKTRQAAMFDASANCEDLLDVIEVERLQLRYLFLTHTHEDHVSGVDKVLRAHPRAELWSSELELLDDPRCQGFKEGAYFHVGGLDVRTMLTSGHSPGQTTYFIRGLSWPLAIVGDSLFSASIGGSPEHFQEQLKNDKEKVFRLPRDTVLACGHGPLTTLDHERKHNPFFVV